VAQRSGRINVHRVSPLPAPTPPWCATHSITPVLPISLPSLSAPTCSMPTATPTVPPASISPVSWSIALGPVTQWRPPMPRATPPSLPTTVKASIERDNGHFTGLVSELRSPGKRVRVQSPTYRCATLPTDGRHQFVGNVPSQYGFWLVPFPLAAKGQSSRRLAPGRIDFVRSPLKAGGKSTALRVPR
jgi:hypothetical protein